MIPRQPPSQTYYTVGPERHVTSQCLGINDWDCSDCIATHCRCECHSTAQPIGEVPC